MPSNQELLVDAFCGAGFFAKALVGKFQRIVGIDWDRFAIAAAKEDATEKETYIAGDIEAELSRPDLTALSGQVSSGKTDGSAKTAVIVDPPAVGLSARLRKTIVDLEVVAQLQRSNASTT
jgi:tRNA/tmRNA/rRNA uracil-C5-methylase (TrmA/RlmC/RlmD family)